MEVIALPKAIEFVMSCCNPDGGFGEFSLQDDKFRSFYIYSSQMVYTLQDQNLTLKVMRV